jgi:DNA-binding transcriptional ArsR family regulator
VVFRALNDPTRRAILEMLRSTDLTAGEIAEAFDMTKPSISHHLSILQQAGLVDVQRSGRFLRYSLNTTVVEETVGWLLGLADARGMPERD